VNEELEICSLDAPALDKFHFSLSTGDDNDDQACCVEAAVRGVLIACIYLPNQNPQRAGGRDESNEPKACA